MDLQKYTALEDIDTTSSDWTCRLRAQDVWKGINRETQQFWGVNIIFLDDSNNRIHAFINAKYLDNVTTNLEEGEIYVLSSFKVKEYAGNETYRAIRTSKHIYFNENTKCVKASEDGLPVEKYGFDFCAYPEISQGAKDNRFLIDVAGIVQNTRSVVSTGKNNIETRRFMFELTDGRHSIPVTLFNELGESCERELGKKCKETVVMIIASAKISLYDGAINLTNYPATRLYINPEHFCVAELRNAFKERTMLDISSDEDEKVLDEPKVMTLGQLSKLGIEWIKKEVTIEITVKRVDEKASWYFARCGRCDVQIQMVDGDYKCGKCNRVIPHPDKRFRVFTICSDGKSSVGIVFPDSEIKKLLEISVFDIQGEYLEEPAVEPFPDVLKQLQHKHYTIKILLNEENIKNNSVVYEAVEVITATEISANHSPGKQKEIVAEDMSILDEIGSDTPAGKTPQTAKSTTKKTRARKTPETLAFDQQDKAPPKLLKNIKLEKQ